MQGLSIGDIPAETEVLSENDKLNEYIMTSLRTSWGLDLDKLNSIAAASANQLQIAAREFFEKEWLLQKENVIYLSPTGKLYADHIAAELFFSNAE